VRVLFASTHGAGHVNPLLPFLEACLARGHDVLLAGPPSLDPRGYPFHEGASPPEEILAPLWQRLPSLPPGQAEPIVVGRIFARLNVEAMLPSLDAAVEDWRPDLVVREANEYASAIAAERHGVPHARVAIGLAFTEAGALTLASPALEERQPGIVARIAASPYLSCFPPSFDPAGHEIRRYRDPAVDVPAEPLPDWWPGDDRPLVYVTFGSVAGAFASARPLFAEAVRQVAALPVRVLLTLGRDVEVGPAPENVHIEEWVPQGDVLGHAAAVVCHGGSGTTLGALARGVPVVAVPLFADQPFNAIRVTATGAGLHATIDEIGTTLARVLADSAYRRGAERLAAELRELPPIERFLDDLP
jgi:UDP:flavonoid glycosyltransferase YjiC (YdhE family)